MSNSESRIIANNILWGIFIENLVNQKFKLSPHALKVEPKHLSTFSKNLYTNKLELCYKCSGKILVRDIVYVHYTGQGFKSICPNCDSYTTISKKNMKNNKNKNNNKKSTKNDKKLEFIESIYLDSDNINSIPSEPNDNPIFYE